MIHVHQIWHNDGGLYQLEWHHFFTSPSCGYSATCTRIQECVYGSDEIFATRFSTNKHANFHQEIQATGKFLTTIFATSIIGTCWYSSCCYNWYKDKVNDLNKLAWSVFWQYPWTTTTAQVKLMGKSAFYYCISLYYGISVIFIRYKPNLMSHCMWKLCWGKVIVIELCFLQRN